ncbi:MAG: DUF4157 domain-containing protein [Thiothrix sp.]|uniref:eCIS core domain-containing protein n=1 Tax=Thiothrix sp. TaxID=1032 RepID=UPI00262EFCD2|nr:DUF4157 domain-containing protein [Thiothrix sp.]MDD5393175.1 DUF4157 domain-containing protein [Thiothrix sp.]
MKAVALPMLLACCLMLVVGVRAGELTAAQQQALASPPAKVTQEIEHFLPRLLAWYAKAETGLLPQGRPLNPAERSIAHTLAIRQPDNIRIVVLETFPLPDDAELRADAEASGMGSEDARTMGDAILLKPYVHEDPAVIAHELVHIAQHDRLGREAFMRRYLTELEVLGYDAAPLEVEAYERQDALLGKVAALR